MTDPIICGAPAWTEAERLAALERYAILDTPAEPAFDDIVQLVVKAFDAPIAVINLIGEHRQWFKAEVGLGVRETPLDVSICARVLLQPGVIVIPDLTLDDRFSCNPLVSGQPHLRFYAGCALVTGQGFPLGTLCVLSDQPRPEGLSDLQSSMLRVLAAQVVSQLDLRLALLHQANAQRTLRDSELRHRQILESATDYGIITIDLGGLISSWNVGAGNLLGWSENEILGQPVKTIFTGEDRALAVPETEMSNALILGRGTDERWHQRKNGTLFWASGEMMPLKADDGAVIGFLKILRDRTTQRAAEARAHADRERLDTIVNQAAVGIAQMDVWSKFILVNQRYCDMLGCSMESLLDRSMRELVHPDDVADTQTPFNQMMESSRPFTIEHRHVRPDGSIIWVNNHLSLTHGQDGSPESVIAVIQDITEQKRAKADAQENEAFTRLLIDSASDCFYSLDRDGVTTLCNKAFLDLMGFAREEDVIGRKLHDVIHHSHPDGSHYAVEECPIYHTAKTGKPAYVEDEFFFRVDGTSLPVEYRAQPIIHQGELQGAICTFVDITERQRAQRRQAALVELGDALRLLDDSAEIIHAAMKIVARTLDIARSGYAEVDSSQQCCTVMRDWTDGSVGSCAGSFVLSDFGAEWSADLRAGNICFVEDVTTDPRTAIRAGNFLKLQIWSLVNVPLIRDDRLSAILFLHHAEPRMWLLEDLVFIREVADRTWAADDRARSQAMVRQMNETLELQVEERTRELKGAEEALRQAHKMEAIGQLTGGIAHDFNNLLAGITGSLELLQRRIEAGRITETQKYINLASGSAHRAAALTHRLLAFARRQSLHVKPVDVNELVASIEDLLRRTIGEDIAFSTVLKDGLWPAVTDTNQFENAILNLVINARDAMPSGGHLTIETNNTKLDRSYTDTVDGLRPGDYVVTSVSDTGTGMPLDVIEKAFDPFFTTKPIGQGTGLGLSMIYGFIKQSGGHVQIYSHEGRGTTVKLYLPRCEVDLIPQELPPSSSETPRAEAGETVMVVEDDAAVRLLILEVLGELGYAAIEAQDGKSALPLLESERRIDLLVTDVGLPGMNGRQLAEIARQHRPDLKVLFVTGYAEGAAVRGGFLAAGMEMITKPFALDTLAKRIREMIEKD